MQEQEKAILQSFVSKARAIAVNSAMRQGTQFTLNLTFQAGKPVTSEYIIPPAEARKALMVDLRPMISLQDEAIYFYRVHNICARNRTEISADVFSELVRLREEFSNTNEHGNIRIDTDDGGMTPRELVHCSFNGEIFHGDDDKRNKLEEIRRYGMPELLDYQFNDTIIRQANIVIRYADLVAIHLLGDKGIASANEHATTALELAEQLEVKRNNEKILRSESAVAIADAEKESLFSEVLAITETIKGKSTELSFEIERKEVSLSARCHRYKLCCFWYRKFVNSLDDSRLDIVIYRLPSFKERTLQPEEIKHNGYQFTLMGKQIPKWIDDAHNMFGSSQLAGIWVAELMHCLNSDSEASSAPRIT